MQTLEKELLKNFKTTGAKYQIQTLVNPRSVLGRLNRPKLCRQTVWADYIGP